MDYEFSEECHVAFENDHDVIPPAVLETAACGDEPTTSTPAEKPRKKRQREKDAREENNEKRYQEKKQFRSDLLSAMDRLINKL